jgi:hypothetical protein
MSSTAYTAEQTAKTPLVNFDPSTGNFEIKGKSIPENSLVFYKPVFAWLDEYVLAPAPSTVLNIQLDYFNTSSSKCILDLFKIIENIFKNSKGEITINWLYDENDEDMQEAGEDYQSLIKSPFNLVAFQKS